VTQSTNSREEGWLKKCTLIICVRCLQCFGTVGWASGRTSSLEKPVSLPVIPIAERAVTLELRTERGSCNSCVFVLLVYEVCVVGL